MIVNDLLTLIMKARDAESASSSALGQNESLCPNCKKNHTQSADAPIDLNTLIGSSLEQEQATAQKLAEEEAKAFSGGSVSPAQPTEAKPQTEVEHSIEEDSQKLAVSEEEAFENLDLGQTAMSQAEAAVKREEANHLKAKTKSLETDNDIKKWIAEKTFNFMAWWCGFVAVMVFMYFGTKQGKVEKEVIIALMGTTTISVVGLVGFIVKGLFGVKEEKAPAKSEKSKDGK